MNINEEGEGCDFIGQIIDDLININEEGCVFLKEVKCH